MKKAYELLENKDDNITILRKRISCFQEKIREIPAANLLINDSAIQGVIIPGNNEVKKAAEYLQENNMDVRPVLSPTVPAGTERLRICLHSFNTESEIDDLVSCLKMLPGHLQSRESF